MRSIAIGLVGALCGVAVMVAQSKINSTDPQPTCAMCPGYYIPAAELQALPLHAESPLSGTTLQQLRALGGE